MRDLEGNLTGTSEIQRHAEIYINRELVKTGILQAAVVQQGSTEHSLAAAFPHMGLTQLENLPMTFASVRYHHKKGADMHLNALAQGMEIWPVLNPDQVRLV